jgi:hypothetical protein
MTPAIEALEVLGVPYHLGGSVASSVHGIARSTADVDVVAHLQIDHVQPLVAWLEAIYFIQAEDLRDAIERRSSCNIVHLETMVKLDIFVPPDNPFDHEVQRRVVQDTLEEDASARLFNLASPEDALLQKLRWYHMGGGVSERQWNDVLGILKMQAGALDVPYLWHWARALGVAQLLERALRDAG